MSKQHYNVWHCKYMQLVGERKKLAYFVETKECVQKLLESKEDFLLERVNSFFCKFNPYKRAELIAQVKVTGLSILDIKSDLAVSPVLEEFLDAKILEAEEEGLSLKYPVDELRKYAFSNELV